MSVLTIREPGKKVLATGAEAFARGALEAGIGFFATYPGTPASGVGDAIAEVQSKLDGLYFEYSMNEKIRHGRGHRGDVEWSSCNGSYETRRLQCGYGYTFYRQQGGSKRIGNCPWFGSGTAKLRN
jgi:hypothetical protein